MKNLSKKLLLSTSAIVWLGYYYSASAGEVANPYLAIDLFRAHEITRGSANVKVALLSTTVNCRLPELAGSIQRLETLDRDFDACENLPGSDSFDINHGTYSASVLHNVAPDVKIVPIRVFQPNGGGSVLDTLRGFQMAIDAGVQIIAYGGGGDVEIPAFQRVCEMVDAAAEKNITVVVPAGNSGQEINSARPTLLASCKRDNLVAVAALNETISELEPYSAYSSYFVQTAAPAVAVGGLDGNGELIAYRGSTPSFLLTAGAVALRESRFPNEDHRTRRQALLRAITPVSSLLGKVESAGSLNAYKLLDGGSSANPFPGPGGSFSSPDVSFPDFDI